jgi:hypothetical protein
MNQIEQLLTAYRDFVSLPWQKNLAGAQKVWFLVYHPSQERRLQFRISEFELATQTAGHDWSHLDLTPTFANWMANHKYREAYFQQPELMRLALNGYEKYVSNAIKDVLIEADENTVVALSGIASLFGLTYASTVLEPVISNVRGRLLVFFPGRYENNVYRLLDARDGWNYLAIPITAPQN